MKVTVFLFALATITFFIIGYADSSSFLANSDFEQGHEGMTWWTPLSSGSGGIELNSDYNHTPNGKWSLKISSPEGGKAVQNFFAEPGKAYTVNGYIMSPYEEPISGDGVRAYIKVVWKDAFGNQISDEIDSPSSVSGPSAWQNVSIENIVAPEGAMYGEFSFVLENASSGAAYFDNAYYIINPEIPEDGKTPFANINILPEQSMFDEAEPGGRAGTAAFAAEGASGYFPEEGSSGGDGSSSNVPECSTFILLISGLLLFFVSGGLK
ncbi:MAG: hypothetical protein PHO00_01515 [bacterium]|nr:hypothetical protein [bacterium]